ncbi:MAG TPA: 50S ribosomal protein L30 [Candidatus Kapabacteria bacterium]|nr:50S ribosomal protein L30 [Candidatus Kapabacteria bacterium]
MAVKEKSAAYPLIKIKLKKSLAGRTEKQRAVVKGLGLRKIDSEVIREKRPEILGMVQKVYFLLQVTDVEN